MSWSMSTEGTPAECIEKAREKSPAVEESLPDFEKPQVDQVINAADGLLAAVPDDAKVILNLSGSGWRNPEGGGGSLGVGISYTLTKPEG